MRSRRGLASIALCCSLGAFAYAQNIKVRAVDSRTGNTVTEYTQVWLYDSSGKQILVDRSHYDFGKPPEELFETLGAAKIGIASNGFIDCRKVKNPMQPDYSTTEILLHGIVTMNHCSSKKVGATPGVIVLFVRPQNWFERHFIE